MADRLATLVRRLGPLFFICVFIPTLISIVFFGLIASDVYVSESSFIVHSTERKSSLGIGAIFQSGGLSSLNEEANAVHEYLTSRDAAKALNRNGFLEKAYGRKQIDFIDRFGSGLFNRDFEALWRHFKAHVKTQYDSTSSIASLDVRAYTAEDAKKINLELLRQSEDLVNRVNERSRADTIAFAERDVDDAERRNRAAASALSAYREHQGIVDPEKQAATQLQLVAKLQDELLSTQSQLAQIKEFTPQNPQISFLEKRVLELRKQIGSENGKVTGGQNSLAGAAAVYQRLYLDSQFADKQLTIALASLEEAKSDARRKQAYVEVVVNPNLPDVPTEPRRMRGIFATFMLGLVAWGIATMLLAGLNEHQD